ncbi:alpha-amylase family glycosyl hydrolase [Aquimarina agarivorans]|uniref:alpha-amylase family glycosyl hydrolase n=1 Tax=Aquimarina agarivorans TaxID=980584 RepID=UPI000248F265|nr:alpha-amylase family glycosyl hydrolase [Aquimarina agarivorans]
MEQVAEQTVGMGAVVTKKGTMFRVWAPHANQVFVTGDFNNWAENKDELKHEENGYWAIFIKKAKEGQEYKFIVYNGDQKFLKNDPYAKELTNSNGNSVIKTLNYQWDHPDFKIEDWNKLVIYELHVGTFNRSNDKDSVANFKQVVAKLPYLKSLGINCIELLPVAEFAGGISWGYNPAHPFAIEQDYGGPDGFAALVNEAHNHGIAVIMDVVYNHFGPSDVDLWQFDGWSENDKGGIYFYNDYRSNTPWGDTRPDYGREEVRRYIRDNALMWIEDYKCDGLRMDATSYIRYENGGLGYDQEIMEGNVLMRDINNEIKEKYPHILTIAEDLKGDDIVTDDSIFGGLAYGSQWDSKFVHPVRETLLCVNDADRDLQKIVDALLVQYSNDVFKRVIYTESHDEVANGQARVPEEVQPGEADSYFAKKRAILGICLTLTAAGIPMLFQGQEFAEDEYFKDTEGLDWEKFEQHKGLKKLVSDIIKLRTGKNDTCQGLHGQFTHIIHFNQNNKVLAFQRSLTEDFDNAALIVLNFSNTNFEEYKIGLPQNQGQILRFNSDWKGYDDEFTGASVSDLEAQDYGTDFKENTGIFQLPAYGCLIFSK